MLQQRQNSTAAAEVLSQPAPLLGWDPGEDDAFSTLMQVRGRVVFMDKAWLVFMVWCCSVGSWQQRSWHYAGATHLCQALAAAALGGTRWEVGAAL